MRRSQVLSHHGRRHGSIFGNLRRHPAWCVPLQCRGRSHCRGHDARRRCLVVKRPAAFQSQLQRATAFQRQLHGACKHRICHVHAHATRWPLQSRLHRGARQLQTSQRQLLGRRAARRYGRRTRRSAVTMRRLATGLVGASRGRRPHGCCPHMRRRVDAKPRLHACQKSRSQLIARGSWPALGREALIPPSSLAISPGGAEVEISWSCPGGKSVVRHCSSSRFRKVRFG